MAATVTWMKKASEKVPERQRPQYASEIQLAFPGLHPFWRRSQGDLTCQPICPCR